MEVSVIGAGVAGLTCAVELAERGAAVEVLERGERLGATCCSWFAGGMLAPWCELESSEPVIADLGGESLPWWQAHLPQVRFTGSLVVAHGRDAGELARFARRTQRFEWLDAERIRGLEPDLAGRFHQALFFPEEGHLDPRDALQGLARRLDELGVPIHYGTDGYAAGAASTPVRSGARSPADAAFTIDCTGLAARRALADLRGVKGEMLIVRLPELKLARPVRVLHPRLPLYVVPRGEDLYMVGATMIESDQPSRISARSMLELLSGAYALDPAFGEAEIVEIGTGVRPAFRDNLPRIVRRGRTIFVNGLYRHGFLIAPALARRVAELVLEGRTFPEVMTDEDSRQRRLA